MRKHFRERIIPPMQYVLSVLDLVEQAEHAPAHEVRERVMRMLGRFDIAGPLAAQYLLARYAVVYWADEVLMNSQWEHADEWRHDPLELEYFGTRQRAWMFFEKADEARGLSRTDALETFALCVATGFRGIYRNANRAAPELVPAFVTESHGEADGGEFPVDRPTDLQEQADRDGTSLPDSLDDWMASVCMELLRDGLPPFRTQKPEDSERDATPLTGARSLRRWLTVLIVSLLVTIVML